MQRFEEAKALIRKTRPISRRVLGGNDVITLRFRCMYASCLYKDANATLDDLREAVETLEDVERIARRVLGGAHPFVDIIEHHVRNALRAREMPGSA